MDAKFDPTIIVGSLLKDTKKQFCGGQGKIFRGGSLRIQKSFLELNPKIIVITNIDNDHLDYYRNLNNIKKAFAEFCQNCRKADI